MKTSMTHLDNIAIRQRKSRVKDAIFAAFLVLGAAVAVSTMSTAVNAASTRGTDAVHVAVSELPATAV